MNTGVVVTVTAVVRFSALIQSNLSPPGDVGDNDIGFVLMYW